MKETFVQEARENLQDCLKYLEQLRNVTDKTTVCRALFLLIDNLCEPAMMVGMPAIFEIADQLRRSLAELASRATIEADMLQKMEQQCYVMQSILAAEGTLTLSANDILAHDLKSPLGIIKTTVENLLQVWPHESAAPLQRILRQTNKGLQLLSHWLQQEAQASAQQDRKELAVMEVVEECCESWQSQAQQKNISISQSVEKALTVHAHALYLSQILHNLMGNAIKFSGAGGRIEIKALKSTLPGSARSAVLFHVLDQGPGIDEQQLPYLFLQRIQARVQDRLHGSGLGLAICKQLCEWHGGTIWVRSQLDQGSVFSFVIPDNY
jgi:signal transduction histidine kinase